MKKSGFWHWKIRLIMMGFSLVVLTAIGDMPFAAVLTEKQARR
jgi:hypothetical protein